MKITSEQKMILDDLICERLSASDSNESLIDSFASERGESLVNYFKTSGIKEEYEGNTAYYIIKTAEDEILMFFSMKCGALFDPLDEDEVERDFHRLATLLQAIENANGEVPKLEEAREILTKYEVGDRVSPEDLNQLRKRARGKNNFLQYLGGEKQRESNDNILRVMSTHPGVELVHFCTNDNMKSKWKDYNLPKPMGETLFWYFIAPKVFQVQELVGCKYAFLFAADLSEDGTLVNYYDVSLKFKKSLDVGTNKPFYDFCCDFMCQEVNEMKENRELFFENFNIDDEDILA